MRSSVFDAVEEGIRQLLNQHEGFYLKYRCHYGKDK